MKICFAIPSLHTGGSSKVVTDLACSLSKRGHKCTVLCFWNIVEKKYFDQLKEWNVNLITLNKKNLLDFSIIRKIKKIKNEFDIFSSHLTSLFYLAMAGVKKPIVHTIHSIPKKDIPLYYRVLIRMAKSNIYYIACSKSIANEAKHIYKNVLTVSNGIKLVDIRKKEKQFDFIYVGRLARSKNILDLLEAFKLVKRKKPKASLCICGDGSEKIKIKNFIKDNHISNVCLTGNVSNPIDWINKSKILCLFSSFEGGPICLLESLLCNVPIVYSLIDGNLNYANDFVGRGFELHSIDSAAKNMLDLLEDTNLYKSLSENCSKEITKHDFSITVDNYERIFNDVKNIKKKN